MKQVLILLLAVTSLFAQSQVSINKTFNGVVTFTNTTNMQQVTSDPSGSCPGTAEVTSRASSKKFACIGVWTAISGSGSTSYTLPAATATTLGGVIVPTSGHLAVDGSGNITLTQAGILATLGAGSITNTYLATPSITINSVVCTLGGSCSVSGGGTVASVFGRTGTVIAASADYTAAQVTNAVDTTQTYSNPVWITALAWAKITGAPTFLQASNNLSDLSVASTARTNLGLGSAATQASSAFDASGAAATAQAASLQKTSNLSDLGSAATARTNLGLATVAATGAYADLSGKPTIPTITGAAPLKGFGGNAVAATAADVVGLFSTCSGTQYLGADNTCHTGLQSANNLSDLASVTTARTNLGLGSAATQASSAFDATGAAATAQAASLQKTSNLSDLASASTARTNLGLSTVAATGVYSDLTGRPTLPSVFVASGAGHTTGLVPDPGASAGTVKYLREDATWGVPPGGTASPGGASGTLQFSSGGAFAGLTNSVVNNSSCLNGLTGCLELGDGGPSPQYPLSISTTQAWGTANQQASNINSILSISGSADTDNNGTERNINIGTTLTGNKAILTLSSIYAITGVSTTGTGTGTAVAHDLGIVSRLQISSMATNMSTQDGANFWGDQSLAAGSSTTMRTFWSGGVANSGNAMGSYRSLETAFVTLSGSGTLGTQAGVYIPSVPTGASSSNVGLTIGGFCTAGNFSMLLCNWDGTPNFPARIDKPITSQYQFSQTAATEAWLDLAQGNGLFTSASNSGATRGINLLLTDNHNASAMADLSGITTAISNTNAGTTTRQANYLAFQYGMDTHQANVYSYAWEDSTAGRSWLGSNVYTTHVAIFHVGSAISDGQGSPMYRTSFTSGSEPFAFESTNSGMRQYFAGPTGLGTAPSISGALLQIFGERSTTGTRALCIDSSGNVHSSASACSGT